MSLLESIANGRLAVAEARQRDPDSDWRDGELVFERVESVSAELPVRRSRLLWPWMVSLIVFFECSIAGWWLLSQRHYAIKDALSRTLSARLMVMSRDPHLGAMGFYWMPIPTVTRIPFVLVLEPFNRAVYAGPLTSALFAALCVPVFVAIGRVLTSPTWLIALVVGVWTVSPVTIFMGANGMSESTFVFFVALSGLAYVKFSRDGGVWNLAFLGVALALGVATRYEMLVLAPCFAVGAAMQLTPRRWARTVVLILVPPMMAFGAWSLASKLIVNDSLFWLHTAQTLVGTPDDAQWLPADRSFGSLAWHVLSLSVLLAPALVGLLLSLFGVARRASWGLLLTAVALPVVLLKQLVDADSWGVPRFFMVTVAFGAIAVLWVPSVTTGRLRRIATVLVAAAGISGAVTGTIALSDRSRTWPEGEADAFFRTVTGADSNAGAVDDSGPNRVYDGDLRPYLALVAELDQRLATGERVAMDSLQAVPALLSDHPKQFVVPEDRDFEIVMSDPVGRFEYIVIMNRTQRNMFSEQLRLTLKATDRGTWRQIGDYNGYAELWQFVPGPGYRQRPLDQAESPDVLP